MAIHMITGEAGVEHVTSANAGALNAMEVGTGKYVFDLDQKFNYNLQSNNIIRIYKGQGIINGRHFEMSPDQYQDLEISNGAQNEFRKDLVVVRYSKNLDTGIESGALIVIEGESVSQDPVDPAYNNGSILDGESVVDFPLYRINIEGLNVTGVDKLFQEFSGFKAEIDALNTSLLQHSTFPSGVGFYPDEKDGVKGYNTDPNRGADTFSPFSSGFDFKGERIFYKSELCLTTYTNYSIKYTAEQDCIVVATAYTHWLAPSASNNLTKVYEGSFQDSSGNEVWSFIGYIKKGEQAFINCNLGSSMKADMNLSAYI